MNYVITLAGCIILNKDGKILLIHRNTPKRTQWETPGGKIEEGENPRLTAKREVEEEIGVKVRIVKELGRKEFNEDGYIMIYIWFLASVTSGAPKLMEKDKYDELSYFTWNELEEKFNQLSPNTQNVVKAHQKGEFSI